MTTIYFKRGDPPGGDQEWNSYIDDPSRLSYAWQFRSPRVENVGAWCKEVMTEGIAYGTGSVAKETKLIPYSEATPDEPGFACIGRAFVEGKLQWILRATSLKTSSSSRRVEGHAATIWDEPYAGSLGELDFSPASVVARLKMRSVEGRTAVAYAQQYWRTIYRHRPVGCVLRAVRYAMICDELDGPVYDYSIKTVVDPDTYNEDGELCGLMFASSSGSDLQPHAAHLILRRPLVDRPPPAGPAGRKPPVGAAPVGSGSDGGAALLAGAAALIGGAAAVAFLRKKKQRRR